AQNITLSAATDSLSVTGGSSSKRHTAALNLYCTPPKFRLAA
ncbi:adhesin, partial [Yersinia pestis]